MLRKTAPQTHLQISQHDHDIPYERGHLSSEALQSGRDYRAMQSGAVQSGAQQTGLAAIDNCSSHNSIPSSLRPLAQRLTSGGVFEPLDPVSFGSIHASPGSSDAKVAGERVHLHWRVVGGTKILFDTFEIINNAAVSDLPPLIGRPAWQRWGIVADHSVEPATITVAGETFAVPLGCGIDMLEIEFLSDAEVRGAAAEPPQKRKIRARKQPRGKSCGTTFKASGTPDAEEKYLSPDTIAEIDLALRVRGLRVFQDDDKLFDDLLLCKQQLLKKCRKRTLC